MSIIAPNLEDSFYANCVKNGKLPVVLSSDCAANIRVYLNNHSGIKIQINIVEQKIIYAEVIILDFEIHEFDENLFAQRFKPNIEHLKAFSNDK